MAGLVFVDPTTENFIDWLMEHGGNFKTATGEWMEFVESMRDLLRHNQEKATLLEPQTLPVKSQPLPDLKCQRTVIISFSLREFEQQNIRLSSEKVSVRVPGGLAFPD